MVPPAIASTVGTIDPGPLRRPFLYVLAALVVAHAGLVAWAVSRTAETPWFYFELPAYAAVTGGAFVVFAVAFAAAPRYARALAWCGGLLASAALLTPGVTLQVLAQLLNAYVVGEWLLAREPGEGGRAPSRAVVSILAGVCVWIALVGATAAVPTHFTGVYAVALFVPLLLGWRKTAEALRRVGRALVQPTLRPSVAERGWLALLVAVVVVHLFLVAKPEAGYDAMAMHLQIPALVADAHRFAFDASRYAWAVMPLGADWAFTMSYLMGGEGAARLVNFSFAVLVGVLMYEMVLLRGRRDVALASVCLFAAMPLAYLQSSTLHVECLWTAFLMGALLLAIEGNERYAPRALAAIALLAAGAMQTKVIGLIWIAPLAVYVAYRVVRERSYRDLAPRDWALVLLAVAIAAWPYVNAWVRTGNPVFPFMNAVFKSPLYDTVTSFNNPLYNAPLRPWSPYEIAYSSGRFIEGSNGAAGFHWLLLLPVILLACIRWRSRVQWLCIALAAIFFVGVYSQQSYLRYLLPYLALLAVIGGWAVSDIPDGRFVRGLLLVLGLAFVALDIRFIYTSNWANLGICPACAFDGEKRRAYMDLYAPDRVAVAYLNDHVRGARVGFLAIGGSPAGYVGYSRAGNWHDNETFLTLTQARSVSDIVAFAKRHRLTHIVYRDPPHDTENPPLREFHERYTTPIYRGNGVVVARVGELP